MNDIMSRVLADLESRVLADSTDRPTWLDARVGRIGGSDAAGFAKIESAHLYLKAKLGDGFKGNHYTAHGNDRERAILRQYKLEQNTRLFRSVNNDRHVCTPDAYLVTASGELILAQVKTSSKPITKISPTYARQMLWEQYVMGASRTLFIWEHHDAFQPVHMEPESQWFHRDDAQIGQLITIADLVLAGMDEAAQFKKEMNS